MKRKHRLSVGLPALFILVFSSGCAELIGVGVGVGEGMREIDRQQIRYCGPDAQANFDKDQSSFMTRLISPPNFDKLCGKTSIEFIPVTEEQFPPTVVDTLQIYKIVSHFKGLSDEFRKNEIPPRPYRVLGTLKFPKRWYYPERIDEYLKEQLSRVGAHAVLEYHAYQDAAMERKHTVTGERLDVFRMSIEATVIRFTD